MWKKYFKKKDDARPDEGKRKSKGDKAEGKPVPKFVPVHQATAELQVYSIKLGWIQGVLIPCLLNIWGVMLFLRIAWVVAQAGLALTLVIIGVSAVVCVITTLSLSAICTNGNVKGGGVYYLVSRSLGAGLGASVGIIFAIANSVAASMNTIGFCDSLNELLKKNGLKIIDNGDNDTRIIGAITLLVMCVICAIGMDWESKAQNFLIVIIVTAILTYILGSLIGPSNDRQRAQGFVGISSKTAKLNWNPDFRFAEGRYHHFFSVFAIYFPAITGVQAGANICGDLKDPATAIPKGTLLALAISTTSYLAMATLCGLGALRDASGDTSDLSVSALEKCKPNCPYGLHNNYEIMHLMALWSPLIYAGCWAATLSTALTNLLSVPRLIQALGKDQIYPGLSFFAKPYGRVGEPYRGYVLVYIVSLIFLLIADLNTVAPLITNFYLASYALINFCTFHADYVRHISWRPQFRWHWGWLSFLGFLLCLVIMLIISWIMTLITAIIFFALYYWVVYMDDTARGWGSSTEAQKFQETINYLLNSYSMPMSIKAYNPQLLVLAGRPYMRPTLLHMGNLLTKHGSYMIVADIVKEQLSPEHRRVCRNNGLDWLHARRYRSFYVVIDGFDFAHGARAMIQAAGFGRVAPNILLLGYKLDWTKKPLEDSHSYVSVLRFAFERHLALTVLRSQESVMPMKRGRRSPGLHRDTSSSQTGVQNILKSGSDEESSDESEKKNTTVDIGLVEEKQSSKSYPSSSGSTKSPEPERTLLIESSIDAWWLYNDGGLNILLPYIISHRSFKESVPLRIYALTKRGASDIQQQVEDILSKYRIEYSNLTVLQGLNEEPSRESVELFNKLVEEFKTTDHDNGMLITEEELKLMEKKTRKHLQLRDLLQRHSQHSALIVFTLPFPRENLSTALYMTWLEVLSKDLPAMLFVRGNTNAVLAT